MDSFWGEGLCFLIRAFRESLFVAEAENKERMRGEKGTLAWRFASLATFARGRGGRGGELRSMRTVW